MMIIWFGDALSLCRTLQNVIQTQKCELCELNKLSKPVQLQPDTYNLIHTPKSANRSLTVMPWTTTDECIMTVVPKKQSTSFIASCPRRDI